MRSDETKAVCGFCRGAWPAVYVGQPCPTCLDETLVAEGPARSDGNSDTREASPAASAWMRGEVAKPARKTPPARRRAEPVGV